MRTYLTGNISNLSDKQLTDIICGSRKTITQKYKDLKWLAETTNDEYANEAFKDAQDALSGLELKQKEVFVVIEKDFDTDINQEEICGSEPAFSIEQVNGLIDEDLTFWSNEENEEPEYWYEIMKYDASDRERVKWILSYHMMPNTEIWFYKNSIQGHKNDYLYNQGLNLYLPIPFEVGDILTIDCRPFRPMKHAVLLEKGNDCCTVTCAWVSGRGTIRAGSLMHTSLWTIIKKVDRGMRKIG